VLAIVTGSGRDASWRHGAAVSSCELGPTFVNRAFPEPREKVEHHTASSQSPTVLLLLPPRRTFLPTQLTVAMSNSSLKPSTIAVIAGGTIATGLLAYAVYFDHKRRNDPQFRKQLKKESKRTEKQAKEEAEAHGAEQKKAIREAVERANEEGFPTDTEEVEAYFMQEVAQGEGMVQKGMAQCLMLVVGRSANFVEGADNVEAALCFYRALKVYPNPRELINIYDKTVPKVRNCIVRWGKLS
jgi:import receptor subunit TOM20